LVAAFFANDGAALILTPIILAKMKYLKMNPVAMFAFLMAGGFIGDSASNPLVISNLTNIVTAGYFGLGFWEYARTMFLPNLLSIIASIVVLWLFFRKDIPAHIDVENLATPEIGDQKYDDVPPQLVVLGITHGGVFHRRCVPSPYLGIRPRGCFGISRHRNLFQGNETGS
jgi:Na+/H+ antiporter NhaD/arsenite permease-like protein